jgi:ribosomal protein S18 acetylase RimI-like enzyme
VVAFRLVDIDDTSLFGLVPPCADPAFDHRTCDYWEDADRGSKLARPSRPATPTPAVRPRPDLADNPFASTPRASGFNPFAIDDEPDVDNPFLPRRPARPRPPPDAPRKYALLSRGIGVFGTYAKLLLADETAVAYAQFGPLSAYPRALRLRDLYRQLPDAPLPAVITCIATTAEARDHGWAHRLVEAVCDDLAERGFAAVETYPEVGVPANATSGATPQFWATVGFQLAVADDRYPVCRRELV